MTEPKRFMRTVLSFSRSLLCSLAGRTWQRPCEVAALSSAPMITVNSAHTAAVALGRCRSAVRDGLHLSSWPGRRPGLGSGRARCAATDKTGLEVTEWEDIEDADLHIVLLVCLMCAQL